MQAIEAVKVVSPNLVTLLYSEEDHVGLNVPLNSQVGWNRRLERMLCK